jgi:large subunit ribosomal protein L1
MLKAIEEAKTKSKKRNFIQSVDLVVNFRGIDFSKPENRIELDVVLPAGRGKGIKIAAIAGDELMMEAKKHADFVIAKQEIEKLGADKKGLKKLADNYDFFLCQTDLMPLVGRFLGQVLGPRGKMPKPVPGNAKLQPIVERLRKTIKVKSKGKFLPTLHFIIGTEDMTNENLAENAETVLGALKEKLPNKEGNIKSLYLKTSMGPVVKI